MNQTGTITITVTKADAEKAFATYRKGWSLASTCVLAQAAKRAMLGVLGVGADTDNKFIGESRGYVMSYVSAGSTRLEISPRLPESLNAVARSFDDAVQNGKEFDWSLLPVTAAVQFAPYTSEV